MLPLSDENVPIRSSFPESWWFDDFTMGQAFNFICLLCSFGSEKKPRMVVLLSSLLFSLIIIIIIIIIITQEFVKRLPLWLKALNNTD